MFRKLLLTVFTAFAIVLAPSRNVDGQDRSDDSREKVVHASSVEDGSVTVDGILNEAVWLDATWVSDFLQSEPNEGAAPSESTRVAVVFDGQALYIGARMFARDPQSIRAVESRRDNDSNAEKISVSLDTYNNHRTAYTFAVTASGTRIDYFHDEDRQGSRDYSFDPVWEAEAHIDGSGWTAELRIPFSQLRFNPEEVQVWGINFNRSIPSINEDIYWIYIPRNETGWASRFGRLFGIANIRPSRRLELLPYVASGGVLTSETFEPEDPFGKKFDGSARAGLDVKMGLGPNLTLDATINPDFGQVEADPAEVNLSAFETFFSERRPFFSEGSDVLGGSAFYSRRIGASPRGSADGDYVDEPDNTTILAAAKVSGRLASGFSIAALGAATEAEYARTYDVASGEFGRTKVEPFAGYLVLGGRQELGPNASTIGFKLTGAARSLDESTPLARNLNSSAIAAEGNGLWRSNDGAYSIEASARLTNVNGTRERITRLQRSPVHYFQRPDIDYVSVDSSATSLTGYGIDVFLSKNTGQFRAQSYLLSESPNYDPNDLGRLSRADEWSTSNELQWRAAGPGDWYQSYRFELSNYTSWNYGLLLNTTGLDAEVNVEWLNFWETQVDVGWNPRTYSDFATRGGPRMAVAAERNIDFEFDSNRSKRVSVGFDLSFESDELDRHDFSVDGYIQWQPGENIELELEPNYEQSTAARQYIATVEGGPAATFGSRYIFSQIDQSELSAQLRVNYTFSPKLTLELYAEPFSASGRFYQFGELMETEGIDLLEYGTSGTTIEQLPDRYLVTDGADSFSLPDRDFNVRSFRSNVVLRWEWRAGSTMYLVWQQDRSASLRRGTPVRPGSLFDSIADAGDNFFGFKMSYWLPVRI